MRQALALLQLNIELDKHLDLVKPFLASHPFDVLCIQELLESNVPFLEEICEGPCFFVPTTRRVTDGRPDIEGNGIFSKYPVRNRTVVHYGGCKEVPKSVFDIANAQRKYETQSYALSYCDIEKNDISFRIGTTHFTWSPDGRPDEFQRRDLPVLLSSLQRAGDMVLCGDLNAPRGGEIFAGIAAHFTDNIPQQYTTSMDGTLHRAGPLELMVDCIFSTDAYRVSDVERICGLSDHCAFTALIEKTG